MRTAIVPAQVTTVEDRIAGNLSLSQLLLLTGPVFGSSALFVLLPPFFNYAVYKVVLIAGLAVLCGLLAIRIKEQILLMWLVTLLRYNLRPRYYVFDKRSSHLRQATTTAEPEKITEEAKPKKATRPELPPLSAAELVKVEDIMSDPKANFRLEVNKKGELSVRFTEV